MSGILFPPQVSMDGNTLNPPGGAPISSRANQSSQRVDETNVVRVAFGVRRPRRTRPERPNHWATLVLPLQAGAGGLPPMPPHAA